MTATALPPLGSVTECPACHRPAKPMAVVGEIPLRYCCDPHCLEGGPELAAQRIQYFREMPTVNLAAKHMHRVCPRCGYEWLEATLLEAKP